MIKRLLPLYLLIFIFGCDPKDDPQPDTPVAALELTNLAYGSGSQQQIDVFLPEGRNLANTPLILYIHGGGWIQGSKEEFLPFKSSMNTLLSGFAFASINYSLFNVSTFENPFPTQENDVIEAIEYIESMKAEWDIEGGLILVGASAGGHLALLHAYKHQAIGNIQSVVALFPPTELSELYNSDETAAFLLSGLLEGTPETNPTLYNESSPVNYISPSSVPSIFFHGDQDLVVPISQSELLAKTLQENGVIYEFQKIPGQGHGFTPEVYPSVLTAASQFILENQ